MLSGLVLAPFADALRSTQRVGGEALTVHLEAPRLLALAGGGLTGQGSLDWQVLEASQRESPPIVNGAEYGEAKAVKSVFFAVVSREFQDWQFANFHYICLLYTSPSPRDS